MIIKQNAIKTISKATYFFLSKFITNYPYPIPTFCKMLYNEYERTGYIMTKLIMNADDFGLSEANSLGIIKAHREGIVTSTTMQTNQPAAKFAASLMKDNPNLGVGLHLTLSVGKPLTQDLKTIVDEKGNFLKTKDYFSREREIDIEEVRTEYQAQMDKFIELTGQLPTHIDHHHSHDLVPHQEQLMKELADKYGLPMRNGNKLEGYTFTAVPFQDYFYDDTTTVEQFIDGFEKLLDEPYVEMMCHPGFVDDTLFPWTGYIWQRARELTVLTHPKLKAWLDEHGVELINYKDIKK